MVFSGFSASGFLVVQLKLLLLSSQYFISPPWFFELACSIWAIACGSESFKSGNSSISALKDWRKVMVTLDGWFSIIDVEILFSVRWLFLAWVYFIGPLIPIEVIFTVKFLMEDSVHGVGYFLTLAWPVLCGCELLDWLFAHPSQMVMLSMNRAPTECLSGQIEAILKLKLGFLCLWANLSVLVWFLCSFLCLVFMVLLGLSPVWFIVFVSLSRLGLVDVMVLAISDFLWFWPSQA